MKISMEVRRQIAEKIVSVLSEHKNPLKYGEIKNALKKDFPFVSVGLISSIIWNNVGDIKSKIQWDVEVFGEKEWQHRMLFTVK